MGMSNTLFSKCLLLVSILVLPSVISAGGKGGKSLEQDSCFCDQLMEFKNNLNYKIFIEGSSLKDIVESVKEYINKLQSRIQNEIPARIELTSLGRAVNGSRTTKTDQV